MLAGKEVFSLVSNEIHSGGSDVSLGSRHVRVDAEHGSVVVEGPREWPRPRARQPRRLLPRRGRKPVGRKEDLQKITAALSTRRVVEIVGPDGVGKSTVLRALAYELTDSGAEVVYLDAAGRDVEDVVLDLFEA
jgi:Mrp family chromosome partitioning ATPase